MNGGRPARHVVLVGLNFTPIPRHHYRIGVTRSGRWQEIFNSDSHLFGGDNVGNFGTLNRIAGGEVNCNIPANGLIIFQRISE